MKLQKSVMSSVSFMLTFLYNQVAKLCYVSWQKSANIQVAKKQKHKILNDHFYAKIKMQQNKNLSHSKHFIIYVFQKFIY